MKILGIDPGMAIVGYSIVDFDGNNINLLNSGSIQTEKGKSDASRLYEIFQDISQITQLFHLNQLFFHFYLNWHNSALLYYLFVYKNTHFLINKKNLLTFLF